VPHETELHLHFHRSLQDLEAGLDAVRRAPADEGRVALIVRRPAENEREVLAEATLDDRLGLVGDAWSSRTGRRPPDPARQVTVMGARAAALVAGRDERWQLAGDQLYVDLDISEDNLPPGSRLGLGAAVIEVSAEPHLGCAKFAARFGRDALRFVNSETGRRLRLRGLNARVVVAGTVRVGDRVRRL
jgi:MOSC domain-containing protein YiiM